MTSVSAVATNVRIAAAASAIVAAATLAPVGVANASPFAPLPQAGIGSTLAGDTLAPCEPEEVCAAVAAADIFEPTPALLQTPAFWFGPANPNFQPLIGIVFPNFFGLDFEFCVLGAAVHMTPYGGGFIGLGAGC
jgi:hypothetical protein